MTEAITLTDVQPTMGSRDGWSYKSYKRIGAAEIPAFHPGPDGRIDVLYGVYGVRNDGREIFAQFEGYRHADGSVSGRSLLAMSMDYEPYVWGPAEHFAQVKIFDQT